MSVGLAPAAVMLHDLHDGVDDVLLCAAEVIRLESSHSRTAGATTSTSARGWLS
jgi:hypothetical protein